MSNLFYFAENFNYLLIFVNLFSALAVILGILTIIYKNPVRSILSLISLFTVVAIILAIIGLVFVAMSYILVYVGAVSMLFAFVIMLISIKISELSSNSNNSIPLVILVSLILSIVLGNSLNFNFFESMYIQSIFTNL
jgi:NADH-ubiquinone oxidoreductase chain 6